MIHLLEGKAEEGGMRCMLYRRAKVERGVRVAVVIHNTTAAKQGKLAICERLYHCTREA